MARLLSVNVGLPRDIDWRGRVVRTAIWKQSVKGRCRVRRLNLEGDGQGDLEGHGGEQRAVFVYQIESYRVWEQRLGRRDFTFGQFGENFTVDGLPDNRVCIGDRYRVGSALFEVTQPRVTCFRVGIRMDEPRMAALLTSSGLPGFYCRVLEEGEVAAGDDFVKVGEAPERLTVAEANALLYSSRHPPAELERALRVEALSPGWRASFQALLASQTSARGPSGNAGLAPPIAAHPAAPGFASLAVSRIDRECADVLSFWLEPTDGRPLTAALPGQFVVLRLPRPEGPLLYRSYSLSGPPSTERYRISVKIEAQGVAGAYLAGHVRPGDRLDVSAPRGSFVLEAGERPVVLLSAGIGATPVLAMLHALAASAAPRPLWWLHGARNRASHPFAAEARALLAALPQARGLVLYSRPGAEDQPGRDFDRKGRLAIGVLDELGVPSSADFYLCGPSSWMHDLRAGLAAAQVAPERVHTELFAGLAPQTPGLVAAGPRSPHLPIAEAGTGPLVSFARSGVATHWKSSAYQSLLELAEACDVPVRWSCRTGVCHSCESGLVSGEVSYGPEPLDAPAAGNLLICCSRPQGDVVIDI
jgi:ferredoxin-NADP reductase/MOSC domain-containing protein YiiM